MACLALAVAAPAQAQERRSILWLFETPESAIDPTVVPQLFEELLVGATDAEHIVGLRGLASFIERNGYPLPDCVLGLSPCPDLVEGIAEQLRLDIIATVRTLDDGRRMILTVRGVPGGGSRTLEFTGDTLRATAFHVVTDFVGASANLAVTSRPTGAEVLLDGRPSGPTPYQAEIPAGIYEVRVELEGYVTFEQLVELRPSQARLIDVDLEREYAQVVIQSATPGATVLIDGEPMGPPTEPFQLDPGEHTIRVEAPDHTAEERAVNLEPGSDRTLQIQLRESPEAIRRRRMGYVYDRPFYARGAFRFAGTHEGLSEATGDIDGVGYTVRCPRSPSVDGGCSSEGLPMNWIGLDIGVGYAFKIFELGLLSFSYAATQIGGAAGDGRTLTLIPDDPAAAGRGELAGRVTAVSRIDLRFLSIGFRVLFTDTWSIFGHGGVGWYREAFDAEDIEGTPGGFSRTGWDWMADIGVRYYLNDTFFAEGAFALGDDLSHDDSDLTTAFTVGLGVTWPDFLGIDRLIGGRGDGPEAPDDEAAPPDDLGSPEETP